MPSDNSSERVSNAGDAPAQALLCVRGLASEVDSRVLWSGVDLSLQAGDRVALVGPSGSGKTVLLRTLAGLVEPVAGSIRCQGKPLHQWWMPQYRAQVMYLPQRPALPEGSVEEALAAPFRLRVHRGRRFLRDSAAAHLKRLGRSAAFLGQQTATLSGGESQLVNVMRAVMLEPAVLLLDEPTASLDAAAAAQVEELVEAWMAAGPRACVWTSHDRSQLARVTARILDLDGRSCRRATST